MQTWSQADWSALNPIADQSGLRRLPVVYQAQIFPTTTTNPVFKGPMTTGNMPNAAPTICLDIEAPYNPLVDQATYISALNACKGRTGGKVSVLGGFPWLDTTICRADMRSTMLANLSATLSIADACDFFAPMIYMPTPDFGINSWKAYADVILSCCSLADPVKPVLPFLWHGTVSDNSQVPLDTWLEMIRYVKTRIDGAPVCFWSGSWEVAYLPRMVGRT